MNVCLFVLWGDSLTFTVANALAFGGHRTRVVVADSVRHSRASWGTTQRITQIPNVEVVVSSHGGAPVDIGHLIIQGHPLLTSYQEALDGLAAQARRITLISAGDRSRPYREALRLQFSEMRWLGRWLRKTVRIAYKDGFYAMDPLGLMKSRKVVGFDAHSKLLLDRNLFQMLHNRDWQCTSPRPFRASFVGSRDPAIRSRILDSVEPFFSAPATPPGGQSMVWHAYTDADPAALSPAEFLDVLSQSDFTLSPPGYSLVTHRPVEALLRGSIPVLNADELGLYDMDLADDVNCIAVPPNGWPAAMERIARMPAAEVIRMRSNIQALVPARVTYGALARSMVARLGLDDRTAPMKNA